jgi:hypothetical protein
MLPDQFRIGVQNNCRSVIDADVITIKLRGKYIDVNGKLNFDSETADILSQTAQIAVEGYKYTSTVDNGAKTFPWFEMDVFIEMDFTAHTNNMYGTVNFFLQKATGDTPVWSHEGSLLEEMRIFNFHTIWNDTQDFQKDKQRAVIPFSFDGPLHII